MMSAVGELLKARVRSQAATYNATNVEQNATLSLDQATADAAAPRRHAVQVQGSLIANLRASGVTVEATPTTLTRRAWRRGIG